MASKSKQKPTKERKVNRNKPFMPNLEDPKSRKRWITIFAGVIVFIMVASMIVPYMGGNGGTYKLPDTALKNDVEADKVTFNPQNIALGETYNRVDKEYFVLFGTAEVTSELASGISGFPVYTVDSSAFGNKSLTQGNTTVNGIPQNPNAIKIKKDAAMIRIKDKKAIAFQGDKTAVQNYIKTIK